MNRTSRCLILCMGCVGLLAGALAAEEMSPETAPPLTDMSEVIPYIVKFIEEIGKGELDAAREAVHDHLSKGLQNLVDKGPFEPGFREHVESLFGPFRESPSHFETVEFIGYRPVSLASRNLVFIANGEYGPALFQFRMLRYQGQWKVHGVNFMVAWEKIESYEGYQRFPTPQVFELTKPASHTGLSQIVSPDKATSTRIENKAPLSTP